jgi:pimeloyl-ACP methyl ester carboxylesterase
VDPNRQSADLLACLKAAQSLPYGDLTAFDTTRAMQDLDAVRAALGAQQINLIGGSYGTRAGLEYLRLFPERVRRLVLDGVAPPDAALPISMGLDARAALLQHIERCEASSECKTQFPNLRQQWSHLVQQKRIQVRGLHPITGQPEQFSIPGYAMWELGRMALYAPEVAAVLPHSISQASVGNWAPFLGMLSLMNGHPRRPMAGALHFSVICAEDFPVMTGQVQGVSVPAIPADAQAAVQASAEVYRLACPHWPKAKVDRAFYSIRTAPAPVAILSGGSDPVTPPHHGDRVARLLGSKAIHAVVPNAGHGVMGLSCVRDALFEFINATSEEEALKAPIHCARDIPAPSPFQPLGHRP